MAATAQAQTTATDPVQAYLERRGIINRANSAYSTGPRTESGKQRSSLNALSHGLTARTAVLPTEDPAAYQLHIQQFLDEYAPTTATTSSMRIVSSPTPKNPSTWRAFQKPSCVRIVPGRQSPTANPGACSAPPNGFVFSKQQVEHHAQWLMHQNPTDYAAHPCFQADPPSQFAAAS